MCIVSNITSYPARSPYQEWDYDQWGRWKRLIEEAQKFDQAMGEPNCVKPEKEQLLKEMQEYFDKKFAELEKRLTENKETK